jgi:hypothetical protein
MNYEDIKDLASEQGVSVKDFLALSPNNDPFYVGAAGQVEKAEWFAKVYEEMGAPAECHVRRVHYWLVSRAYTKPDGKPYENTERDWQLVTIAAKYARYLNLCPVENIVDRRNPPAVVNAHYWPHESMSAVRDRIDAASITDQIVNEFLCFNPSLTQAYMLEVWCEKSTMNDVLHPICREHGANLVTGLGELSITAVHSLMDRIEEANKPTRIFYVSDFDPAGECMPVSVSRKIEYFVDQRDMKDAGYDVKLLPIMLTSDQCKAFKLPRTPIKETERRASGFEARHGAGATELDALEALRPGEMRRIIRNAMREYFDVDAWNDAIAKNEQVREQVRAYLADKINDQMMVDLDTTEFDDYEPRQADADDNDNDDNHEWLYDSERDYEEQLRSYRDHQQQSRRR